MTLFIRTITDREKNCIPLIALYVFQILDKERLFPGFIEEGFMREIVSKVQTMRKEAGFEVMDRIVVTYQAGERIDQVLRDYGEGIRSDVLADGIEKKTPEGYVKEWDVNGEPVALGVQRTSA